MILGKMRDAESYRSNKKKNMKRRRWIGKKGWRKD
jgi:hypothetical protein